MIYVGSDMHLTYFIKLYYDQFVSVSGILSKIHIFVKYLVVILKIYLFIRSNYIIIYFLN